MVKKHTEKPVRKGQMPAELRKKLPKDLPQKGRRYFHFDPKPNQQIPKKGDSLELEQRKKRIKDLKSGRQTPATKAKIAYHQKRVELLESFWDPW